MWCSNIVQVVIVLWSNSVLECVCSNIVQVVIVYSLIPCLNVVAF